ncbi:hypothetical protein [Flagellimonas sp.]|uniref:hypothetical protein n=1 Tax=Flagellimonas sp. TaxID=2058762 RepID=UPI003F4A31FF
MKKKEVYWLIGTLGLAIFFTILLFGMDGFDPDATLEINIHDTYFVIANSHFVLLIFILTFFWVYLFRIVRRRFKNLTVNLILLVTTIALILVFGQTISILDAFSRPISLMENSYSNGEKHPVEEILSTFAKILFVSQIGLLILLAYCGFQSGRYYKTKKT